MFRIFAWKYWTEHSVATSMTAAVRRTRRVLVTRISYRSLLYQSTPASVPKGNSKREQALYYIEVNVPQSCSM